MCCDSIHGSWTSSESVEEKPVASVGFSSHVDVSAESEGVVSVPEVKLNNSEALSWLSETLQLKSLNVHMSAVILNWFKLGFQHF